MAAVPSRGRAAAIRVPHEPAAADTTHALYERYGQQIYRFCLQRLRNREEAEDATQTTFLNAFRGLERGTAVEFESAWLYKIALHVCLTKQRSSNLRRVVEAPSDFEQIEDLAPSREQDTDELFGLDAALRLMPEQQRRAFLLREWQGLSYKEIADQLRLSQSAVETLLFRARRSLADALTNDPTARRGRGRPRKLTSLSSMLTFAKPLVFGGGAKVVAAVATVAATSVVATTPAVRHHLVEAIVGPVAALRHQEKAAKAPAAVLPEPAPSPRSAPRVPSPVVTHREAVVLLRLPSTRRYDTQKRVAAPPDPAPSFAAPRANENVLAASAVTPAAPAASPAQATVLPPSLPAAPADGTVGSAPQAAAPSDPASVTPPPQSPGSTIAATPPAPTAGSGASSAPSTPAATSTAPNVPAAPQGPSNAGVSDAGGNLAPQVQAVAVVQATAATGPAAPPQTVPASLPPAQAKRIAATTQPAAPSVVQAATTIVKAPIVLGATNGESALPPAQGVGAQLPQQATTAVATSPGAPPSPAQAAPAAPIPATPGPATPADSGASPSPNSSGVAPAAVPAPALAAVPAPAPAAAPAPAPVSAQSPDPGNWNGNGNGNGRAYGRGGRQNG